MVFSDTFPSYLSYYSSSPYGSYDSYYRVFSLNLGTLSYGSPKTVYIYMTVNNAASSTQTLNNTGTLHFYHGTHYQFRQSNTVQYRVLGTSTLPGTGFPPLESNYSNHSFVFWTILLIGLLLILIGLGGVGFGFVNRLSQWANWSRQMGGLIAIVGGLFFVFGIFLNQQNPIPLPTTISEIIPSPSMITQPTKIAGAPAFQDYSTLPDYPIPTPTALPTAVEGQTVDDSPPNRILIPSLGLDTIVKYVPFDGYTWLISGLQNEIAWMGSTSWPGLGGNTGLAGHVTLRNGADGPFRQLESLQAGDVITVVTERNLYTYKVRQQNVVKDDDFSIVKPSQQPILTLITCAGWNSDLGHYLQRLIVIADLTEVKPLATHGMVGK